MVMKRIIDKDLATSTTTNFQYEESSSGRESDDSIVIQTVQDVSSIIKHNKIQANEIDKHQKYGEWSKVASIPMSIYYELKKKGIANDQAAMKKWLNDPDNKYFKTRGGRI